MNEQWVIDKLQSASAGGDLVKIDPESAVQSFYIGIPGGIPKWGEISGNIENQTDLKTTLDKKIDKDPDSPILKIGHDSNGLFIELEESA